MWMNRELGVTFVLATPMYWRKQVTPVMCFFPTLCFAEDSSLRLDSDFTEPAGKEKWKKKLRDRQIKKSLKDWEGLYKHFSQETSVLWVRVCALHRESSYGRTRLSPLINFLTAKHGTALFLKPIVKSSKYHATNIWTRNHTVKKIALIFAYLIFTFM